MTENLESMLKGITAHPALDNDFYREWMSRRLRIEELEVFARNYGAWVRAFPDVLAVLVAATDDLDAKSEYVKTLYSEMGYGNPAKAHWVLLDEFFAQLASKMGHESKLARSRLDQEAPILHSTRTLIEEERQLYRDSRRSTGAQLALEWQAYTMLRKLYDGARNYLQLWSDPDGFHESCEYFYTHIGAAEKDHKVESLNALKRYGTDKESLTYIIDGYNRHLELIAGFWEGLYNAIREIGGGSNAARFRAER